MSKNERRKFLKKSFLLAGAGTAGAVLMGGLDRSVLAAPSPTSEAIINQWSQIGTASCVVFVDSGGSYYVKDTGIGPQLGDLIVNVNVITPYGASLGAGTVGALTTTAGIQEAVNCLRGTSGLGGGKVQLQSGVYSTMTTITTYPGIAIVGPGPLSAFQGIGTCSIQPYISMNSPVIEVLVDPNNTTNVVFPYLGYFTINGIGGTSTSQDGIYIVNTNGTVADVYIEYVGVFEVGGVGLHIYNPGKHWIDHFYSEDNKGDGVFLVNAFYTRISKSYIFGNGGEGINADNAPNDSVIELEGNWIIDNTTNGMNVKALVALMAYGNYFYDNGNNGYAQVVLNACPGVSWIGNTFNEDRAAGARSLYGLDTAGGASVGVIANNNFLGTYHTAPLALTVASPGLYIKDNPGVNPINLIANPFATSSIGLDGSASIPTASTDYLIGTCDIFITAANSSNSNNSITIKDGAGNTIQSGLSALTALYVPAGYKINWGAFTGTAGAVTVWGV